MSAAASPPTRSEQRWFAWLLALPVLAVLTVLARLAELNSSTVGFLYLLAILGLATWGGWAVGFAASLVATLCFNYFFLPPLHTLTIADPANWVSLASFLLASALVSHLVSRTRHQAAEASRRRHEVETLYELCFGLFAATPERDAGGLATARALRAIGADDGGLLVAGDDAAPSWLHRAGTGPLPIDPELFARAAAGVAIALPGDGSAVHTVYLPLGLGRQPRVLVATGALASAAVVEPAARLLALAFERERLLAEAAHLAALRQSEAYKTALLRAVSHDLRTPLTGMRLLLESLERQLAGSPQALAAVLAVESERQRLSRRIDNLLAMARLEAGLARPHREPLPAAALIRGATESLSALLAARPLTVSVHPGSPEVEADPSLALEVLVNLLDNAARLSPTGEAIEVVVEPAGAGRVRMEIRDRGPGMPAGGPPAGGLGLHIAHAFAAAQGWSLDFLGRPGGGTIARLDLPAFAAESPEEP